MTTVKIKTNDNHIINLDWDFTTSLDFARSFNDRSYDNENKLWNVPFSKADVQEEIDIENLIIEITNWLEKCNKACNGLAYSPHACSRGRTRYTDADVYKMAIELYEEKIDWEILEQETLESIASHEMYI